jgi:uncharacterized metal-binding protein
MNMFGALFTTWSKATSEKLNVMNSIIGRSPTIAANAQAGKSVLADRGVDDASGTKALQQSGAHFVRPLILGDFFAHQENIGITLQLFSERFIQRLAIRDFSHDLAPLK